MKEIRLQDISHCLKGSLASVWNEENTTTKIKERVILFGSYTNSCKEINELEISVPAATLILKCYYLLHVAVTYFLINLNML